MSLACGRQGCVIADTSFGNHSEIFCRDMAEDSLKNENAKSDENIKEDTGKKTYTMTFSGQMAVSDSSDENLDGENGGSLQKTETTISNKNENLTCSDLSQSGSGVPLSCGTGMAVENSSMEAVRAEPARDSRTKVLLKTSVSVGANSSDPGTSLDSNLKSMGAFFHNDRKITGSSVGNDCSSMGWQPAVLSDVQRFGWQEQSQASVTLKSCMVRLVRLEDVPVLKMWLHAQRLRDQTKAQSSQHTQQEEPKGDPAMKLKDQPGAGKAKSSYRVVYAETYSGSSSARVFPSQSANTEAPAKPIVPILNKFECDICKNMCTGRRGLLVHKRMAHGSFMCTHCRQVFLNKDQLQNHRCGTSPSSTRLAEGTGLAHVTVFPDRSSIVHKPGTPSYFRPAPKKLNFVTSTVTSDAAGVVLSDVRHMDISGAQSHVAATGSAGYKTDQSDDTSTRQCPHCRSHFFSDGDLCHNCGKMQCVHKQGESTDASQATVFSDKTSMGKKGGKVQCADQQKDAKESVFPHKSSRVQQKTARVKSGAKPASRRLVVAYPNGQYKQLHEAHALHPLEKMLFKNNKTDAAHTAVRKRKREPENKDSSQSALAFVCPNCLCSYPSSALLEMHSCALPGSADMETVGPEMSSEVEQLAKFYSSIVYKE